MMDSESENEDNGEPYDWFLCRLYHKKHKIVPIRQTPTIVGRGKDANFQINPRIFILVSRNHCMLQMIDDKPTITDCHSRRGTFVNDARIDKFQPGRIELKEGDLVGIGHKNEEIQQYFKFYDDILKYRVCRTIGMEEAVVISDDDEDEVDVKCILPEFDIQSTDSETTQLSTQDSQNGTARPPSPVPGPSGLRLASVVSIPEELLQRSSFEAEYDMMMCASNLNTDGYESDTEPCVVPSDDSSDVITLSDDDEYAQYSQMEIDEVKQELEDDVELVVPDLGEEETNLWALKLKPDVDATRRYKKRTIVAKEETEPSKPERKSKDSGEKSSSHHKKHRSSSSRSSEEEHTGQRDGSSKEKHSNGSSLKVVLKRSSTDAKWDVIETRAGDAKKLSRHTIDSSKKTTKRGSIDGDSKKASRHTNEPTPSTSRHKTESTSSTSRHTVEPTPSASWQTIEPTPSTSRYTKEPTPSTSRHTNGLTVSVSRQTKEPTPSTSRQTNGPTPSLSRHTTEPTPSTSRQSFEPTPSTSRHTHEPIPSTSKHREEQTNRLNIRRHSTATWTEMGGNRPSGMIELAVPEKPKPSKEAPAGPLWMQQVVAMRSSTESRIISAAPQESSVTTLPKSNMKRRGSVSSVEEAQAMIQKKLKRRYSVSDRNVFDFQPVKVIPKEQKEQRKSRLIEINEKRKQQEKGPPIIIEPHTLGRKTGSTKPKVKFTPNNRGSFLSAPVPPPSTSRVPTTSRPTSIDESIVCTQSTTLDQLPIAHNMENQVIDMRPKKLTFESVARVSNVDRPLPVGSGVNKPLSFYQPANVEPQPTTLTKPQHMSTSGTCITRSTTSSAIGSTTSSTSSTTSSITSSTSSTSVNKATNSVTTAFSRKVVAPQKSSSKKEPLRGILKQPDKPSTANSDHQKPGVKKCVTIRLELNKTRFIESCLDTNPPPVKELPVQKLLQKEIQEQILWQELDLLAEILEWPTKCLLLQEFELLANGPFASDGKMLPKLESYDSYESFKKFHLPFLKRELWQDIYTNAKVVKSSLTLRDVSVDKAEHVDLCKVIAKVRIKTQGYSYASFDFGIMEYHSLLGHTCSMFVSLRNQVKDESVPMLNDSQPGQSMVFTMYAAGRELDGLRSGRNFEFRPLARISLYLRSCNAISFLEHSPLLPNIISPSTNKEKLMEIEKRLQQQPDLRSNVARHMEAGALNPGQMEVVSSVLDECSYWDEPTISLIQGPPGTGKSRVIGQLVLELMRLKHKRNQQMKVLVCASSNTAVDVIVKNLMKLQQRIAVSERFKLVRTGTRNKVDSECLPVFIDKLVLDCVNQENRLPDARNSDGSLQNIERERNMLAKRVKMAQAELKCGRSVNMEVLNVTMRKLHHLEELLNPAVSSSSANPEGRKKQEIKARIRILQGADIVCTTLGSSPSLATYCNSFSVCLIDEATQCTELCSLLPLQYNISKLVLVGDINQLPATVLDQQCIDAGFRTSLFSRLYQSYAIASHQPDGMKMLKTQYRMHPKICQWPNHYFYNNQLKNAPCTEMMRKSIPLKPYMVISLCYDQELTQAQYEIYNKDEIMFVVELMKQLVKCCDKNASFAIITPYVRHKDELIHSLRTTKLKQVEVHSIDSVQGKEFDVVIISLARSNGAGFLNNPERINVAMTRARQCLVLCGNFGSLKNKTVWSSLLEDAEKRKVYYHLEEHDAQVDGQLMVKNIMQRLRMI